MKLNIIRKKDNNLKVPNDKPTFKKIRVVCLKYPGDIRKMELTFYTLPDGPIVLPCNGCEFESLCVECQYCKNTLTQMFINDPNRDTSAPIIPDL